MQRLTVGVDTVAVFTTNKNLEAGPWNIVNRIDGFQMMYEQTTPVPADHAGIVPLDQRHVPAMLELTRLSPPGPFMGNTISFGGYEGIFDNGELVAMAGRRLHSGPYVEISAVATHPDHTGKGHARTLIESQIVQLRAAGNIPYLHVRADNTRAIRLYEHMGFVTRTEMIIFVLKK